MIVNDYNTVYLKAKYGYQMKWSLLEWTELANLIEALLLSCIMKNFLASLLKLVSILQNQCQKYTFEIYIYHVNLLCIVLKLKL